MFHLKKKTPIFNMFDAMVITKSMAVENYIKVKALLTANPKIYVIGCLASQRRNK